MGLFSLAFVAACSGDSPGGATDPPNHQIVVDAQARLSAKVKAADAIVAKVPADKQLSYAFARHATLVRRNAMLDAQAARITTALAARRTIPEGALIAIGRLVDDLRDDGNKIDQLHEEAMQKALGAESAAYANLVTEIVSAAATVTSAVDAWREASPTVPARTVSAKTRSRLAFIGNDVPASWTEGLLPGSTTLTVECVAAAGGAAPSVTVEVQARSATVTKKSAAAVVVQAAKPYVAHIKVTVSPAAPDQASNCTVTLETPRSADRPPTKTLDTNSAVSLIAARDAALKDFQMQAVAMLASTSMSQPDQGNRLRGVVHVVGNQAINGAAVHTPALQEDLVAFAAALESHDAALDELGEISNADALELQQMMDAVTRTETSTSKALKAFAAATQALTANLK